MLLAARRTAVIMTNVISSAESTATTQEQDNDDNDPDPTTAEAATATESATSVHKKTSFFKSALMHRSYTVIYGMIL